MSFPAYKDISKRVTDLFDFNDCNKLTVKSTTASGVAIETETCSGDALCAKVKVVAKDASIGKLTVEGNTCGAFNAKANLTKVADNCQATLKYDYESSSGLRGFSAGGDYTDKQFKIDATIKAKEAKEADAKTSAKFEFNLVGGSDGFIGGLNATADLSPTSGATGYNATLSYAKDDSFGALSTEKKFSIFKLFASHKINDTTLGASITHDTAAKKEGSDETTSKSTFQGVLEQDLGKGNVAKASYACCGDVRLSLSHQLSNPNLSFELTGAFKPTYQPLNLKADSVALALAFGN